MSAPEGVARELLSALDREDWTAAAALIHPGVADKLYAETRERMEYWQRPEGPTAESLQGGYPDMPREVAEYMASKAAAEHADLSSWSSYFPGVASPEEFDALSPLEYLARYLEVADPRNRAREQLQNPSHSDLDQPADEEFLQQMVRGPVRSFLGTVFEAEDLAHVTYRITWSTGAEGGVLDHVDILSLREGDGGWKAVGLELNGIPRNMWFWVHMPPLPGGQL